MGSMMRRLRRAEARAEPERRVPGECRERKFGEGVVIGPLVDGVRMVTLPPAGPWPATTWPVYDERAPQDAPAWAEVEP